jgi:pyruvate dehydrogenase E2 component (dihydrolipoamide acetyltransferase)
MPQMGYDMHEGTVVRWLKAEGDEVQVGEPIAEIETDKAVVEFESTAAGVLSKVLVQEGTSVPVGDPIGIIGAAGEETPEPAEAVDEPMAEEADAPVAKAAPPPAEPIEPAPAPEPPQAEAPVLDAGEVRASPVARRIAQERGIDLSQVPGTGPGGRITREDVLSFEPPQPSPEEAPAAEVMDEEPAAEVTDEGLVAEAPDEEPVAEVEDEESSAEVVEEEPTTDVTEEEPVAEALEEEPVAEVEDEEPVAEVTEEPPAAEAPEEPADEAETVALTRMRQQIARVTVKSKTEIPHFYVSADIDMTEAMSLRSQINERLESEGVRISVNDLVIMACASALQKHPKFNSYFLDDAIQIQKRINIGIAIAEEEGLIIPAVMDCAGKSLGEIARASKDLIGRVKTGTLSPEEYTGGTFTVSNMGMYDVSSFAAIIHPPQAAVLAVGKVAKRPVVRDDEIAIAEVMTATLSADHRVADGAEGAEILIEIKKALENPFSFLV